jgi:Big-like domain-containing protein
MVRRTHALLSLLGAVACTSPTTPAISPGAPATSLVSVAPAGGATNVAAVAPMVMQWDHPMQAGMELFVAVHQGRVDGPVMPMTCVWSDDHSTLTCSPQTPFASGATYTMHVGGGMHDAAGGTVDMGSGMGMGGQWVTSRMMGGGMMGDSAMMGPGWKATNGMYGMGFTFTTAP